MGKLPSEQKNEKIIVKKEAETNPSFGCRPDQRPIETHIQYGIINIHKPDGPTSHQVADYVQKILYISKSGNTGTLEN